MTPDYNDKLTRRRFLRNSLALSGIPLAASIPGSVSGGIFSRGLRAGVSKHRITPPVWVPYLTSSSNGTCAPFQGVHDDLYARSLVLDDGDRAMALLAVDSIGYDNSILGPGRNFTQELRRKIASKTKLKPEAIMLAATHAHSAPETIGLTPFRDVHGVPEWLENHLQELVDVAVEAWKKRVPVRAYAGTTRVEGIARYRRIVLKNGKLSVHGALPSPEQVTRPWQMDEDLSLLYLEKTDRTPHSVLMNYTAHPVVAMVLPQVCADYPGAATAFVEANLKGAVCLFTNGAAGNINSLKVSTNYDDVQMLGEKLAVAATEKIQTLRLGAAFKQTDIRFDSTEITLEPRACPTLAEAENAVARDPSAQNQRMLRLARKLAQRSLTAEIQTMRLGAFGWVSLPGEAFVETGLGLKNAGVNFVIGYANDWLGYFPLRHNYDEGGYETIVGAWSRVAPGSAEKLETAARALWQKVANKKA